MSINPMNHLNPVNVMNPIPIGKIFELSPVDIITGMKGTYKFLLEDGEIILLHSHEIAVSRYIWKLARACNVPITKDIILNKFYEDGNYTANTHLKCYSTIYKKYITQLKKSSNPMTFEDMESKWIVMFDIINELYSELQYYVVEYGISLTILDYIELQKNPELLEAIEEAKKDKTNPAGIELVNQAVKKTVDAFPHNNLAKLYRSGAANKIQITHGIGLRGFVTDINNMVYHEFVADNLTKGLNSFYDLAAESAVMAKALNLQEFGVSQSEWLQRELHLVSMNIRKLELTDCGNRHYADWIVNNKNDLQLAEGTNILLNGEEVELDAELHSNLIGTIIKTRRITECKLLKEGKICSKCLGAISYSIPKHGSPAHILITEMMAVIGQMMLSAKHFTESASLKTLKLSDVAAKYLNNVDANYYVKSGLNPKKKYYLILNSTSYYGLTLLSTNKVDSMGVLDTNKLSKVDKAFIKVVDEDGGYTEEYIDIKQDGRSGILDQEFIIHSLRHTDISASGEYEIDITNYKGRLLFLEDKEFAFDMFSKEFKNILSNISKGKKKTTPDELIIQIYNHLNQKLSINIKLVEMLVAALTLEDPTVGDFSVGLNPETRYSTSYRTALLGRSPGISLGFKEQKSILNTPANYIPGKLNPYNPLESIWNTKNIIWR